MPEKKHRNPFEEHINSETFDVSNLENAPQAHPMDLEMQAFFDSLPGPLNYELWDTELDDRQRMLSMYLTTEIVERVLRVHYADELEEFSDEQLIDILMVPVTLAMLAEERLHEKPQVPEPEKAETNVLAMNHPNFEDAPEFDFAALKEMLRLWYQRTRDFFMRLFRKK
jgi:hypothetical protein